MEEIDFSIIFPSRGHEYMLMNLFKSISHNTSNIERIEVLVAFDDCDPDMLKFIKENNFTFVKFFQVKRSLNFSRDYYNYLYKESRGKWIIPCNDDTEFITPQWDLLAKNALKKYLNGRKNIVYGWIEDFLGTHRLSQFGNYCCFPLLGREGIDALGAIFPERIPTWGADIFTEQLYRNIGRIIKLPIEIKHISIHNGLRPPDEIHNRIATNQVACSVYPTPEEINRMIKVLRPG